MINHDTIRTKAILYGVLLLLLITACEGYRLQQVYTRTQQISMQQHQQADRQTLKLKAYYMEADERIWSDLAEYSAVATIEAARKYQIDLGTFVGVITEESGSYPFARSSTGAKGPGQVDFKAHKERFPEIKEECDKYDPKKNLDCAAQLLSECLKKHGFSNGLQVYNLGENAFKRGQRNPAYVAKVKASIRKYRHF